MDSKELRGNQEDLGRAVHYNINSECLPSIITGFSTDGSTAMIETTDQRTIGYINMRYYFQAVHTAETCRVQREYLVGEKPKPSPPAYFDPEQCSWPKCDSEGLHRWAPLNQPGTIVQPLRYCEPHHKEAKRMVDDRPDKRTS